MGRIGEFPMAYTQIYYHIVFSTKGRIPALSKGRSSELYKYIWGFLKNNNCFLYRIGGIEDHIHILTSLHQSVALSDLIRDLKTSSNHWIKQEKIFKNFIGWQDDYGAFTKSHSERDEVIQYIKNQEVHHKKESSLSEFKRLLTQEGIEWNEKYLR